MGGRFRREEIYVYLWLIHKKKKRKRKTVYFTYMESIQYITTIDDLKEPLKLPVKMNNSQSHYPEISY